MVDNRVTFGSKLGVILATVGCAVGWEVFGVFLIC